MSELSEAEEQQIRRVLNSLDKKTVNVMVLDRKYDRQWYAEQLNNLREMHQFFDDVNTVISIDSHRPDVEYVIEQRKEEIEQLINVYENAIKDLDRRDGGGPVPVDKDSV